MSLYYRGNENVTYYCSGIDHWLASTVCIYIKQQAMLACFRLQVNAQWVSNTCGHSGIKNILTGIVPISHRRCDKIIPQYMFNKNYVIDIPKMDPNWRQLDQLEQVFMITLTHMTINTLYRWASMPQFFRLNYMQP